MNRIGQSSCSAPFAQSRVVCSSSAPDASRFMRISATLCCTSGCHAIERVSATEVRCGTRATVRSKARWACPWYTAAKPMQRPGEDRRVERRGAGEPGAAHQRHELVGAERLVEDRVVALRGPHAEGVPGLHDLDALGVLREEAVDDLRVVRVGVVLGVEPAVGPHGRQAAEDLVAGDLPAAVDAVGARGRVQRPACRCRPRRGWRRRSRPRRPSRGSTCSCRRPCGAGRRRGRSSRCAC